MAEPLKLLGAPGSPYTRKMVALLRYRRIAYAIQWGSHRDPPAHLPTPRVKLLPTVYFADGDGGHEAVVDSTPIIRRLETDYPGRSAIPSDPVLAFLNYLIEDFADEWLTKQMFHYRWAHEADAKNAGPLLIFWTKPTINDADAQAMADEFSRGQIERLHVVGSNATTAQTIEESYMRLLECLDGLIQAQGYALGTRPSSADFAIFGQLAQLAIIEPTSAKLANEAAPRVRAWLDRVEDLSGIEPEESDWLDRDKIAHVLTPLLAEIGRVYVPFLLANAEAARSGDVHFDTEIDGRRWTQPVFGYQAKCLRWIREEFAALSAEDQRLTRMMLETAECAELLNE